MQKFATTFGSSTIENHEKEYREGIAIGRFLAENGYTVKCGGYQGLMEAVAKGAREAGGKSVGMALDFFEGYRPANPYLTEKIVASDLYGRLQNLIEDSELFIVQKGSLGTLNELLLVWTMCYIGILQNIRICLIGKEWKSIKKLELPIDPRLFEILEFYDDADDFMAHYDKDDRRSKDYSGIKGLAKG